MLAASWGEPAVYCHTPFKYSVCKLTLSVKHAVTEFKLHYKRWTFTCTFLTYPVVCLANKSVSFSSPLYPSEYSHVLQLSVNNCANSLCNERTY